MSNDKIQRLEAGQYMSFATRKKSGDFVQTPVWFAPEGDSYYVFSERKAGKVKRLRNFSESRVAPCTFSGKVTGDWIDTDAFVLEDDGDVEAALAALRRKYGWQMRTADLFSRLGGKYNKRAYIRITPRS